MSTMAVTIGSAPTLGVLKESSIGLRCKGYSERAVPVGLRWEEGTGVSGMMAPRTTDIEREGEVIQEGRRLGRLVICIYTCRQYEEISRPAGGVWSLQDRIGCGPGVINQVTTGRD
jgi:hypothetical protein